MLPESKTHLVRQESLAEDFATLLEAFEIQRPAKIAPVNTAKQLGITLHRKKASDHAFLSDKARAHLKDWLAADYEVMHTLTSRFGKVSS